MVGDCEGARRRLSWGLRSGFHPSSYLMFETTVTFINELEI